MYRFALSTVCVKLVRCACSLLVDVSAILNCCRKLAQASSMDAEGRDKDTSFAQRKDLEEVMIVLLTCHIELLLHVYIYRESLLLSLEID